MARSSATCAEPQRGWRVGGISKPTAAMCEHQSGEKDSCACENCLCLDGSLGARKLLVLGWPSFEW